MVENWFWVALLCAFSLAAADAYTKKYLSHYPALDLVAVRFGLPTLILLPFACRQNLNELPAIAWLYIAIAIPVEILAMFLYMRAITRAPLYLTLPFMAFTPILATLTGWFILGEVVSPLGLIGILLVVVGAYLLNLDAPKNWLRPFSQMARNEGSRFMIMAACLYSVTAVLGRGVVQHTDPLTYGPFYFVLTGFGTLAVYTAIKRRPPSIIFENWRRHFPLALMIIIMFITHYLALSMVETAYMITVKRSSLLFGILFGAIWFAEPKWRRNLGAGFIMVAGIALVSLLR